MLLTVTILLSVTHPNAGVHDENTLAHTVGTLGKTRWVIYMNSKGEFSLNSLKSPIFPVHIGGQAADDYSDEEDDDHDDHHDGDHDADEADEGNDNWTEPRHSRNHTDRDKHGHNNQNKRHRSS